MAVLPEVFDGEPVFVVWVVVAWPERDEPPVAPDFAPGFCGPPLPCFAIETLASSPQDDLAPPLWAIRVPDVSPGPSSIPFAERRDCAVFLGERRGDGCSDGSRGDAGGTLDGRGRRACGSVEVGSGTVVTRTPQVGGFERLEVGAAFVVTVTLGDAPAVVVRADDNFADRLDVGVTDGTLHIGLTEGTEAAQATLEADVTAVSLSEIGASGDASIHLADELSGDLLVTMSGASHLDAPVALDHGTLELSGASVATLTGSARDLSASGSGASRLALQGLSVGSLDVSLSGRARPRSPPRTSSPTTCPACRPSSTQGRRRSPTSRSPEGRR